MVQDFVANVIYTATSVSIEVVSVVGIEHDAAPVSDAITLHPPFPNPFNASTTVRLDLNESSEVSIGVFDVLGREVRRIARARFAAGSHELVLDSDGLTNGVYFVKMRMGDRIETRSVILAR
jgi:hypothetical protein